jgi:hypothetical protein
MSDRRTASGHYQRIVQIAPGSRSASLATEKLREFGGSDGK